jgi:hypothetical protein
LPLYQISGSVLASPSKGALFSFVFFFFNKQMKENLHCKERTENNPPARSGQQEKEKRHQDLPTNQDSDPLFSFLKKGQMQGIPGCQTWGKGCGAYWLQNGGLEMVGLGRQVALDCYRGNLTRPSFTYY